MHVAISYIISGLFQHRISSNGVDACAPYLYRESSQSNCGLKSFWLEELEIAHLWKKKEMRHEHNINSL